MVANYRNKHGISNYTNHMHNLSLQYCLQGENRKSHLVHTNAAYRSFAEFKMKPPVLGEKTIFFNNILLEISVWSLIYMYFKNAHFLTFFFVHRVLKADDMLFQFLLP